MKKFIFVFVGAFVGFLIFCAGALLIFSPSSAQKKYVNRWEYAAITFTHIPLNSENQSPITGAANICFLQTNGCQNEEVKAELVYAKFLQDFRLENTSSSKNLAFNRAKELAYTKAVAKLGLEGWEIIDQPSVNFDSYIDNQGTYIIGQGNKEPNPNIYFKRLIQ
ncbi:MAG TPA: hypothetical protein VNI84_02915 [Pyrinomonadaceae bacterium]|nr:hypothetical protein [Pyrinomonadaceae bacterium]